MPKSPPAHHGLAVSEISQLRCPGPDSRSLPDPGYKYLPLHSGGICLAQATMATAFLPLLGIRHSPAGEKATPSLLGTMRKGKNIPSTFLWVTSFTSGQHQASDRREKTDARSRGTLARTRTHHTHAHAHTVGLKWIRTRPAPLHS